jgi:hypothetical protein
MWLKAVYVLEWWGAYTSASPDGNSWGPGQPLEGIIS